MGTLGGFPNPPAMGSREQSSRSPERRNLRFSGASGGEDCFDAFEEREGGERLFQEARSRLDAALRERLSTEAADEQHLHPGPALREALGNLRPTQARQTDVQQQEVDRLAVRRRPLSASVPLAASSVS